ncbi:LacI family DNA-binding transcriptional regulator [Streptomyces lonarensis]|uniref:LacI family transcriptional regulator n=1 Tax=Streptomyces lonarensis TaxID=700599 RepID=A0A7X6D5K2_9ACTN|nr:LacI family DNA-binding transcriptional regulator [Streptomyces lonarensis]NJQ08604.1 LacI family transcriptional regulator [Streptomyces lonarensis]
MTVTLADVAARAGVSAATVSRVLNGNYPVATATRSRVLRAVEELEYVVNGPASSLAAASSDLVGVLVNDIADPFFGIIAGAVQDTLGPVTSVPAQGRKLAVICNTGGSPERELTYLTLLQRQRAAAVVLTGSSTDDPGHRAALAARLQRLAAGGVRVVLCGRPLPVDESGAGEPAADGCGTAAEGAREPGAEGRPAAGGTLTAGPRVVTVPLDNEGGARALTGHLLALGHRRIGYLAGPDHRSTTRHRLAGHRAALAAAGLPPTPDHLLLHGTFHRDSGYAGALRLLEADPGLTAIAAANDTVALGVCAALRDRGLRVPQDVSVTGFDDLPFAADVAPGLTTVRLPLRETGQAAGRVALGTEVPEDGVVPPDPARLVARDSTAPPRG